MKTDVFDCKPIYIYRKTLGRKWYLKLISMDIPYVKYTANCVAAHDQGLTKSDLMSCDWEIWQWDYSGK